jgi:hypothetical protein
MDGHTALSYLSSSEKTQKTNYFSIILSTTMIYGKCVQGLKSVFHFPLQLSFETSTSPINIQRVTLKTRVETRVSNRVRSPLL